MTSNSPEQKIEEEIAKLKDQWIHWVEKFSIDTLHQRDERIRSEVKVVLNEIEASDLGTVKKHFAIARLLNILPEFDNRAKESIERVIKLDPLNHEAWTLLGEQCWRMAVEGKGNPKKPYDGMIQAKRNFEESLKKKKNVQALCNLSMLLRSYPPAKNSKEKYDNLQLSVQKAKEAVILDSESGIAWYNLGNAHLQLYILTFETEPHVKTALVSYEKALKYGETYNPDVHFNKAQLQIFAEMWSEAFNSLLLSAKFDPESNFAKERSEAVADFCKRASLLCKNKGKMRPKRLAELLKKCEKDSKESIDLVVVGHLTHFNYIPFAFVGVDNSSEAHLVTVYNMVQGQGPLIGDIVTIPSLTMKSTKTNLSLSTEDTAQYSSIRVERPSKLAFNKKVRGASLEATLFCRTENLE